MKKSNYEVKHIPVTPHVKKFLIYNFGEEYKYSQCNFLGAVITGVFSKGFRKQTKCTSDITYPIYFHKATLKNAGKRILWDDLIYLNKALDTFFRQNVFTYLDMHRKLENGNLKQKMYEFLLEMDITDEDISYDTLFRNYQRRKKYPKTQKKEINLSEGIHHTAQKISISA